MDTFEFLNIAQVHGFMKILGVLTHLDTFKEGKTLRKTRKLLKHRFWTEVHDGAKLFYLSSIQYGRVLQARDQKPGPVHLDPKVPPSHLAQHPSLRRCRP